MGEPCEGRTTHHAGCACHEARRDADLAAVTAERDEARAEVRRLTAALATVTTERDGLRADMRKVLAAAEALADIGAARAAVERATTEAHRDDLRAALAAARREGAEEMREALIVRFTQRVEYLHPWAEAEDDENGCHSGAWTEALNAVQFTRDMVLPLDAPGGAT